LGQMRVLTIAGTRPELIRLSSLIKRLDGLAEHRLLHTGQNSDERLWEIFLEDLALRPPDVNVLSSSMNLESQLADMFVGVGRELDEFNPNAVMVLGDTNSALCAILAERRGIPVYHMEAGNRSFDKNVPEEINRRVVDHFSTYNFPYTEVARQNLLDEGLHPRNIFLSGSPMPEVLSGIKNKIKDSKALENLNLDQEGYLLASIHRQENVNREENLLGVVSQIVSASKEFKLPVVLSLHPRTQSKLKEYSLGIPQDLIRVISPTSLSDYVRLQLGAFAVISDSGSVAEESAYLGFPAVTLRPSMERPEALESGNLLLVDPKAGDLSQAISFIRERRSEKFFGPPEYFFEDFSSRVSSVLFSTRGRQKKELGLLE